MVVLQFEFGQIRFVQHWKIRFRSIKKFLNRSTFFSCVSNSLIIALTITYGFNSLK